MSSRAMIHRLAYRKTRSKTIQLSVLDSRASYASSLTMAVQQNKKSPSKRGMHRAHDFLVAPALGIEPVSGEVHMRHHISPKGFYRGRKVIKLKSD
jgi:large subunit ribosomal protein L32